MHFRVIDDEGRELGAGRDLLQLQDEHGQVAQTKFAAQSRWERAQIRTWDDLELPESVSFRRGREQVTGFPALIDETDSVRLTLLETPERAYTATRLGIARLMQIELKEQMRALERSLVPSKQLALGYVAYGSSDALKRLLIDACLQRAIWADPAPIRNRGQFDARSKLVRARLQIVAQEYLRLTADILELTHDLRKRLESNVVRAYGHAVADIKSQLERLVHAHFLRDVAYEHLQHFPRYLRAMARRIEKLPELAERDEHHTRELARLLRRFSEREQRNRKAGISEPALEAFRWMLEEQRVSLFAQELRTPYPVSYKRLEKFWNGLDRHAAEAAQGG